MLKLLKNMRRREALMALLCLVFVVVQVYFDLRLPDYMTELTTLIKTSGGTSDILSVGLKMLGCTAVSAALAVVCGFLAAKTASGFSFTVREKLFHHVMDVGSEEMQDFSVPSLITRSANAHQGADPGGLGRHQNSGQELGALGRHGRLCRGALHDAAADHVHLYSPLPSGAESDR